ncbi:MAG: peptidoglycan-binding domain-containing protein [Thiobacillaceae bacterium]
MRTLLNALSVALVAIGCSGIASSAMAEMPYYNPSNAASPTGDTTGYELYKTIGCPGKGLLDPGCSVPAVVPPPPPPVVKAKPAPAPAPKPRMTKTECMANAKPGECYVMIVKEPVYRTEKVKKLVKEASERIEIVPPVYKAVKVHVTTEDVQEVIPAVYETVKEKVMVKPETTRLENVPAVFENVEERVVTKPASKKAIEVPAVYEDVEEKVLVSEAYTTWKKGTESNIQKINPQTGEIFCLVQVPAEYKTVTKHVLKTPATVRYEEIPAEYGTIKKTVLKSPETTRSVPVPAEYAEREVTKLVKPAQTVTKTVPVDYMREIMQEVTPAQEKRIPVPAEYAEVDQQVLVSAGKEYCTRVLCDVNTTPERVGLIQRALQTAGFTPGAPGVLDEQTMRAVAEFQKAKGIDDAGYITIDTLSAMGVPIN